MWHNFLSSAVTKLYVKLCYLWYKHALLQNSINQPYLRQMLLYLDVKWKTCASKQMCNNENSIGYWNIGGKYMFLTIYPPSYLSKSFHWSRKPTNVIIIFQKTHQFCSLTNFQNHPMKFQNNFLMLAVAFFQHFDHAHFERP
jgi:hypothetical protein